jgi:hypothetical protein
VDDLAVTRPLIFFSHTSRDSAWCDRLALEAAAFGITPYLAEHDVQPGTELAAKVQDAIKRSAAVLVLLTDNSANSAYVHQEVGFAQAEGKLVIPLVQPEHVATQMGMLVGVEYVPFDFRNPEADRATFHQALQKLVAQQERPEQPDMTGVVVLACAALLLLVLLDQ